MARKPRPARNSAAGGTGALEGFASFMAEAAMKNAVATKCEVKTVLMECVATARTCK